MKIFRSILPLILVAVATLLVSCSGGTVAAPPTYTPEKLQKIETYRIPVDVARDRLSELGKYIDEKDWVDTDNFIHGPLGSIRRDMTYLSNALLPDDRKKATELAKDIFNHFEDIDAAAKNKNYGAAISEYKEVVSDFDVYLDLVPQTKKPEAKKPVSQADRAMKEAKKVFTGVKEEVESTVDEIIPDAESNS